ncbi:MAG: hypothetical protein DRG78_00470 [Epsilonproteobacteria bacterium]|nr:MAG: hypothetical protein DRG78_00470 [Campylobacterota bacterium]
MVRTVTEPIHEFHLHICKDKKNNKFDILTKDNKLCMMVYNTQGGYTGQLVGMKFEIFELLFNRTNITINIYPNTDLSEFTPKQQHIIKLSTI